MIAATVAAFGRLDVMFNNAGISQTCQFMDVTEADWHRIMDVNGLGVLIGTQEAARQMKAQGGGGKIINTASIAGKQGYPLFAHYCASKFAVVALTQAAARALAADKITVNAFAPGVVRTELWEQLDREFMDLGADAETGSGDQRIQPVDPRRPLLPARRHHRRDDIPGVDRLGLCDRANLHGRWRHGTDLTTIDAKTVKPATVRRPQGRRRHHEGSQVPRGQGHSRRGRAGAHQAARPQRGAAEADRHRHLRHRPARIHRRSDRHAADTACLHRGQPTRRSSATSSAPSSPTRARRRPTSRSATASPSSR